MTYEKDSIPDFALVPARQPAERVRIPVTQDGIFTPLQITIVTDKPRTQIHLEEDILVPDTRPDLKEILDISAKIRLSGRDFDGTARIDDPLPISGEVELQTLYTPEKGSLYGPLISITTRVGFRENWHTAITPGAALSLDVQIVSIESLVINERKYRVKITLELCAREYREQKLEIFHGISGQEIQTLQETAELTSTALRRKDILTISQELDFDEDNPEIGTLLRQEIHAVENYRQATSEKVILNGFIYVNLLYLTPDQPSIEGSPEIAAEPNQIRALRTRVEFTQFIPLSHSESWSGSFAILDGSDLKVKEYTGEEGQRTLRLEGDLMTSIELYRNLEQTLISDAYHQEKDFLCTFEEVPCRKLAASSTGEAGIRELLPLENPLSSSEEILFATARITSADSHPEPGKIITEGSLAVSILCRCRDSLTDTQLFTVSQQVPFRCITASPYLDGSEVIRHRVYLKDLWAEKSGAHQAEFNASVLVCAEAMTPVTLRLLQNPAFEEWEDGQPERKAMAIYMVKDGDTLWTVARKFKSTTDSIRRINQLQDEALRTGQKLLILR